MSRTRSVPLRLLVAWALFIVYGTTLPFDLAPGLDTLRDGWIHAHKRPWRYDPSIPDLVTNVLLFLPWGFLLGLHLADRGRRLPSVLFLAGASAFGMSLTVEFLQLFTSTRTSSTTDLITNAGGGLVGAALAVWVHRRIAPVVRPRLRAVVAREPLTALAAAALAGTLLWAASPFDVSIDVGDLKDSLKHTRPVPFGPPLRGSAPADTPWDAAPGLLAWVLVGGTLAAAARARRAAHPMRTAWLVAAGTAVAAEAVQLVIVSRTTDATTVVFSWIGITIGVAAVARSARAPAAWALPAIVVWAAAALLAGLSPWALASPDFSGWSWMRALPFVHYFLRTDVYALADAAMQVLLSLPAGFLLAARRGDAARGTGVGPGAALGGAVALAVELGQLFVDGRVADVTDVGLGALGGALGAAAYAAGRRTGAAADGPRQGALG